MFDKQIGMDIIKIRVGQMIVNEAYKNGEFKIPIHLAFGHETIAVAIDRIMEKDDKLVLSHRNIAFNLARTKNLKKILNEYFLNENGINEGKLGSMNLMNSEKGLAYTSSILGNNFSVATGIAYAQNVKENKSIAIVLGGDGSMEEGSFHESLLMCKSLHIPCFIIIENNEWSMATSINQRRCEVNLEKFAEAYKIKYAKLEGNNPEQYIQKLKELRKFAVENSEPVCIEFNVTTLGDWIMKNDEHPDGKFINYHAGPAPTVELEKCPAIIKTSEQDPVYALKELMDESEIIEAAEKIHVEFTNEIK
jgi:acetoin:2,6-dichlorophenolindophenol oxidoreductase subunit alpha